MQNLAGLTEGSGFFALLCRVLAFLLPCEGPAGHDTALRLPLCRECCSCHRRPRLLLCWFVVRMVVTGEVVRCSVEDERERHG